MIDSGRRIRRGALIGGLLLLAVGLLGAIVWMQLPALIERQFAQRLAAAGYPGSNLEVETVGLRQFKVKNGSVSKQPWRVQLRKGTARYHPLEIFRPLLRSVHMDGLRIDVDLTSGGSPAAPVSSDSAPWHLLTQETLGQLPLRQLTIVNGLLDLSRGQQNLTLPFELELTNDTANHQLSGVLSGANPQGTVRIEGGVDRESGLRITAKLDLTGDWDPWLGLVLPEVLFAAPEGLQTGPAQVALKLLSRPGEAEWRAFAGEFSFSDLKFHQLQLPFEWTGDQTVRISGGLEADARFHFVPGQSLDLQPQVELSLERVEWLDQTLKAEGIRGSISGIEPESPESVRTNLVQVDRIQFHDYEVTDLRLGGARLNHDEFQVELLEAQFLGGQLRSTPFTVGPEPGGIETVLELQYVNLAKLAKLIPQFAGSIEGAINGRIPLRFEAGRFSVGAATLRLDHDRPARLRYPADGLLTDGIPPDTDRHEQLKLIEEALQDLRLTELVLDIQSPEHPRSPIRVRLEGTFNSAKAIIPVKFNLNVNGGVDEVLRLMSIGKIELSL